MQQYTREKARQGEYWTSSTVRARKYKFRFVLFMIFQGSKGNYNCSRGVYKYLYHKVYR